MQMIKSTRKSIKRRANGYESVLKNPDSLQWIDMFSANHRHYRQFFNGQTS